MNRFYAAVGIVVVTLGTLMYFAVTATAKSVVTVHELVEGAEVRRNIRLGARVADGDIRQETEPVRSVKFNVRDIAEGGPAIGVFYAGIMPDTLKVGRDVILEGNFDGKTFEAKNLVTQCPSKYVPPDPAAQAGGHK